jgi:hypothetical protein
MTNMARLLLLVSTFGSVAAAQPANQTKPNIILMAFDDLGEQRRQHLSFSMLIVLNYPSHQAGRMLDSMAATSLLPTSIS